MHESILSGIKRYSSTKSIAVFLKPLFNSNQYSSLVGYIMFSRCKLVCIYFDILDGHTSFRPVILEIAHPWRFSDI